MKFVHRSGQSPLNRSILSSGLHEALGLREEQKDIELLMESIPSITSMTTVCYLFSLALEKHDVDSIRLEVKDWIRLAPWLFL